ncbi:GNAT family N-acetyltransferase [Streptomyces sp. NPDC059071]|uniref:GNAT family N-acetyltransferase n=1 Tax=Streptomyces sp. NPDC059071 TaxID=3346714 RepID=UPI003674995D
MVVLQLIDLYRGGASRYSWIPPFDHTVAYENEHWWDTTSRHNEQPWYVQVLKGGAEVARVELDDPGGVNPEYAGLPTMGQDRLEIQFIEVAAGARGRGVGTEVVRALEDRHSDRRLFAYSEEADRFWASLEWERFDHPGGRRPPLFIQMR